MKHRRLFFGTDSDPRVAHGKAQLELIVLTTVTRPYLDAQGYLSMICELDRITHKIHKDLANSQCVAHCHVGYRAIDVAEKFQAFAVCAERQNTNRLLNDFTCFEVHEIQVQHAGFNLGEVKNIVNYR